MSGNEDLELGTISASGSASPALSSDQSVDLAASDREEYGDSDDTSADKDAAPPPFGVKLTVFRLLIVTILVSLCITMAVLAYKGYSIAPTTLDWVGGALLAAVLYSIGFYGQREKRQNKLEWLFQVDLAPAIGFCTKRFIGGVISPLFARDGLLFFGPMGCQLYILASYGVSLYTSHYSPFFYVLAKFLFFLTFPGFFALPTFCFHVLTQEVQVGVWAWQYVVRFMGDYGPDAHLANRYGGHGLLRWFGEVGKVAGMFCGIVLVFLPFIIMFVIGL